MQTISGNECNLATFKQTIQRMVAANNMNTSLWGTYYGSRIHQDYTIEKVHDIIADGNLKDQRTLSRAFYNQPGMYRRFIIHLATTLKYTAIVIPNPSYGQSLSELPLQKRYNNVLNYVDKMNVSRFALNAIIHMLVEGVYYGLVLKDSKTDFAILDLPSTYCRTRFKDIFGNDVIEFDVKYFNQFTDKKTQNVVLAAYPDYVRNYFQSYVKGTEKTEWLTLPMESSVCFPLFDGRPFFLNVIESGLRYHEGIELEIERDIEEIKKIIVQKIPHNAQNEFLLEPTEVEELHSGAVQMVGTNKNVLVLTTYADVDTISSKGSADAARNPVSEITREDLYSQMGVSQLLFDTTSSNTLADSQNNTLSLIMAAADYVDTFITKIINKVYGNANISFKYEILPITWYNSTQYFDQALKAANSGYSFLIPALALGITQKDLVNLKHLENDMLGLGDLLKPLSTSYTQSGEGANGKTDGEPGAPSKPTEEKNETTIVKETSKDNTGGV